MNKEEKSKQLYNNRTTRISVDVPSSMKIALESNIPYGLLSSVTRVLYTELLAQFKIYGTKNVISAVLNDRLRISIILIDDQQIKQEENNPEENKE